MPKVPQEIGKKAAVLGLGDSGYQSALALKKLGFEIFATDKSDTQVLRERVASLNQQGIQAECGVHSFEKILACDWFLISPGIPPQSEIYQKVIASGKPVCSEIEAASWFCRSNKIIAVTGSCGKTTTVTLIEKILKAAGHDAVLCGNIGNPWIGELNRISADTWVVLEVSSFQLKHCRTFAPLAGVLLNIHSNHLDWHPTIEDYAQSKLKLFKFIPADGWALLQREDEERYGLIQTAAQKIYLESSASQSLLENAASKIAEVCGIPKEIPPQVFSSFSGLEHRLEKFWEKNGVSAVNDSKSTTPASLIWGLGRFADQSVVLITGGRVKTPTFMECLPALRKKTKKIIVIGEARPMMLKEWSELNPASAASLAEACQTALKHAGKGDTVLFSPACSSFDMFKSYTDRGLQFKKLIQNS